MRRRYLLTVCNSTDPKDAGLVSKNGEKKRESTTNSKILCLKHSPKSASPEIQRDGMHERIPTGAEGAGNILPQIV